MPSATIQHAYDTAESQTGSTDDAEHGISTTNLTGEELLVWWSLQGGNTEIPQKWLNYREEQKYYQRQNTQLVDFFAQLSNNAPHPEYPHLTTIAPTTTKKHMKSFLTALPEESRYRLARSLNNHTAHDGKTVPYEVVQILAEDPSHQVRAIIAKNTTTPTPILIGFTREVDTEILLWVSANEEASGEVVSAICDKLERRVQDVSESFHLNISAGGVNVPAWERTFYNLARNPKLPTERLTRLVGKITNPYLRERLETDVALQRKISPDNR